MKDGKISRGRTRRGGCSRYLRAANMLRVA